jgi:peptidylprolyl isomerase
VKPAQGDTVRVHYTGTLADGSEFDSSQGRDPIAFTIGEGTVIPGFESAVADLEVGESVTVTIPAAEAYGERADNAVQVVPLQAFGESGAPQAGWIVQLEDPSGQRINAMILEVDDQSATLDFNHPLAGQDLTFALNLVEIVGK